jgi:hypothetical protein
VGEVGSLLGMFGGFSKGTLPGWGLFLLVAAGMLLRFTPIWKKLSMTENDKLIADIQEEATRLRHDIRDMKQSVVLLTARCTASDLRVGQVEFALQVATNEIERLDPGSKVPSQIRRLLATTLPTPDPSGISQADMDIIRGVA